MVELIAEYTNFYLYKAQKEIINDVVSVSLIEVRKNEEHICCDIRFQNIDKRYDSPFLNWYNLLFCSNNYGCAPDYEYMTYAVQKGLKTAATVYLSPDSKEAKALIEDLPLDCDSVAYGDSMILVYHKGCIADFFNVDMVKSIYESHGIANLNWEEIKKYANMPMEYFVSKECDISIQCYGSNEHTVIVGLLFGYPIESTIAGIKNMITIVPQIFPSKKND